MFDFRPAMASSAALREMWVGLHASWSRIPAIISSKDRLTKCSEDNPLAIR
jgi:hypothetical protein